MEPCNSEPSAQATSVGGRCGILVALSCVLVLAEMLVLAILLYSFGHSETFRWCCSTAVLRDGSTLRVDASEGLRYVGRTVGTLIISREIQVNVGRGGLLISTSKSVYPVEAYTGRRPGIFINPLGTEWFPSGAVYPQLLGSTAPRCLQTIGFSWMHQQVPSYSFIAVVVPLWLLAIVVGLPLMLVLRSIFRRTGARRRGFRPTMICQ
jgi:hypothetical protein